MKNEAEIASAIQHLLKRTDLKGEEMPAFVECWNWLQSKVDGKQEPDVDDG